jgi:putative membrane protein
MLRMTRISTHTALAAGLALMVSGAALAQATNPAGMTGPSPAPAAATPQAPGNAGAARNTAPAQLDAADRAFVEKAAAAGMAEVQAGQLAQTKAKSEEVKSFAQHMVDDHTAAGDKLKSIAEADGVQPPANLDAKDEKQLAGLQKLNGAAFDHHYIRDQTAAHKEAVALFEKEAKSGSNPQLKQFALDTLPTLKQHLTDVEGLAHSGHGSGA